MTDPMTPQPCRDPRRNPHIGDVLKLDKEIRLVLDEISTGRFNPATTYVDFASTFLPGDTTDRKTVSKWRQWAKKAEVLHAAE